MLSLNYKNYLFLLLLLGLGVLTGKLVTDSTDKSNTTAPSTATRAPDWDSRQNNNPQPVETGSQKLNVFLNKLQNDEIPADWDAELRRVFYLTSWQNEEQQAVALLIFFSKWAERDFEAALKAAGKTGMYANGLKTEILLRFSERDPQAALDYYESHKSSLVSYDIFLYSIAKNWARLSPDEALTRLKDFLPSFINNLSVYELKKIDYIRHEVWTYFMEGLLSSLPPDQLFLYADKMSKMDLMGAEDIAIRWAYSHPDLALKWMALQEKKEDFDKDGCYPEVIICLAIKDRDRAEKLLSTLPHAQKIFAVSGIAANIQIIENEEAALSWTLGQIPFSDINAQLLGPLTSWSNRDPENAAKWIEKFPDSPIKNKVIDYYSASVDPDYYDRAWLLIEGVKSTEEKTLLMKSTLKDWRHKSPGDFEKWQKTSNRTEQIQEIIKKTSP